MALSGLDIYKLLPKTNCKACGFPTCLAFAMQLAKKAVSIDACPSVSKETKAALEAAAQPPIRLVSVGRPEKPLDMGNETVLFRHEEKFRNPCGLGFVIDDSLSDDEIDVRVQKINQLKFERVGQELQVNAVAVKQTGNAERFVEAVRLVGARTQLAIVLMSQDAQALAAALPLLKGARPVVFSVTAASVDSLLPAIAPFKPAVAVSASDLQGVAALTQQLTRQGIQDILLDTGAKPCAQKLWDLTQIRRLALRKSERSLGFPSIVVVDEQDPAAEALQAATYILKYAGLVLVRSIENWQSYALLTLRQNIYSDPQKPLQIEPKLYEIGTVTGESPVLVTTNFSLSYYTVLGEVEASKIPVYILSVDTEGMSVLTAWAAEKFTPERITQALQKMAVRDKAQKSALVIPGYVAVMSGDLEDQSKWDIIVGPKEASGIPAFLKTLGHGKVNR